MAADEPPVASEYQFLGQDERPDKGATQALAPATEDQAQQLQQPEAGLQGGGEEEQDGGDDAEAQDMDLEGDEAQQQQEEEPAAGVAPKKWAGSQRTAKVKQAAADAEGDAKQGSDADSDMEDPEGDNGPEGADGWQDGILESLVTARLADASLGDEEGSAALDPSRALLGLTVEEAAALRQQLDERLRLVAAQGCVDATQVDEGHGRQVWAACEALTAGLASDLTEQLRLILEPTLASRLAGDYRTGKRINMKKVIAYIASHFRKDKIWMRRTRPDKRRYQVLLAIDDSKSMAENGCGTFALEALTLISKAMSRLEMGELGVVSFGGAAGVRPLQLLDQPFSDAVGPRLMGQLKFNEDNTIQDRPMVQLMTSLTHLLDVARHRSGAGGIGVGTQDLHQLVLVIADGRFHEKESLRAAVREAADKRGVCLAFIALDSPQSSLADMQTVSFVGGKPVFSKYLDSFPFPYYVMLRDIAALPRTLADLLRQWFELSSV